MACPWHAGRLSGSLLAAPSPGHAVSSRDTENRTAPAACGQPGGGKQSRAGALIRACRDRCRWPGQPLLRGVLACGEVCAVHTATALTSAPAATAAGGQETLCAGACELAGAVVAGAPVGRPCPSAQAEPCAQACRLAAAPSAAGWETAVATAAASALSSAGWAACEQERNQKGQMQLSCASCSLSRAAEGTCDHMTRLTLAQAGVSLPAAVRASTRAQTQADWAACSQHPGQELLSQTGRPARGWTPAALCCAAAAGGSFSKETGKSQVKMVAWACCQQHMAQA